MRRLLPLLLWVAACGPSPETSPELVVIPPGASVRAVADSLRAHGVIRSRLWFRLVARARGADRKLQRGTYAFARGAGSLAALRALAQGRSLQARFTVPEGFTLVDIAQAAERELDLPRASFLAAARDTALLREFTVPAASFEGFLRPETYLFPRGVSADAVIREMAETFRSQWDSRWDLAAGAQRLDRLALVTLGSIVEAEARADSDRALIAAVYRNRMQRGMALQADATVQYAIQRATGARKLRLYEKDYGFPSPYNTYLHPGLPPGPIGAPGRKSLEAVINPARVPYLYYVARPDGRHVFSRTYAEHLRAVSRVRRAP
jgi:UPF0755 protein